MQHWSKDQVTDLAGDTMTESAATRSSGDTPRPQPAQGHTWRGAVAEFARQLLFVSAGVFVYFRVRGLTEGSVATANAHGRDVLALERRLGIDIEEQVQDLVLDHDRLVTFANWVYIWGHWPVIVVTLVCLHLWRRHLYLLLRNAMFISGGIGLVFFATYAVAPPRLLGVGLEDTVTQKSTAYRLLQPPSLVNQYAAIPSLHVGWNLLVGIVIYRATRHWLLRVVAVVGPLLMAVGVILTGNHYVIDGILGAALALLGLALAGVLTPRLVRLDGGVRQRLHQRRVVQDEPVDAPADQPPGRRLVGDRPAEDPSVPGAELPHQRRGDQPPMQRDPVEGHPRGKPQEEQLRSVSR
jgi:hypothetical protein